MSNTKEEKAWMKTLRLEIEGRENDEQRIRLCLMGTGRVILQIFVPCTLTEADELGRKMAGLLATRWVVGGCGCEKFGGAVTCPRCLPAERS